MLAAEIIKIKKEVVEFSGLVERMIEKSLFGLRENNEIILQEVINNDEDKANHFEINIEERGTVIIARFQPSAKDLRTILMILQINNDLERMADHAVNIAESSLFLINKPLVKPLIDIPAMGETTVSMVKDSLDSFVEEDPVLAKSVCERDNIIDNLQDQVYRELITYMTSDPSTIERSLQLMRISNNLERIADLSTNICEDVIYIVKGEIIKHHKDEN